jgi:hypothetical protein
MLVVDEQQCWKTPINRLRQKSYMHGAADELHQAQAAMHAMNTKYRLDMT